MDNLMSMPGQQDSPDSGQPGDFLSMIHHGAVSAGVQALQSGKIDPVEAAKQAKKLGIGDPNELDNIIKGGKKPFDYTFGGAGKGAAPKAPPQTHKTTTTTPNTMAPETANSELDLLQSRPEYQQLQAGNDDLQNKLAGVLQMQGNSNQWIKPLASLADYVSGQSGNKGTAAAGFTPNGMTPGEQAQTMLKYQDEIQKRKEDNYKALLSGLGRLNQGQGKTVVQVGDTMGGMGGLGNARIEALRTKAGSDFDKDKLLLGVQQTQNSFQKALGFMNGNEAITKPDLDLIQKDIIDGTTKSGSAAMAQVGRETINTLNELMNHAQLYGGSIADLRKSEPQIFAHIKSKIYQLQKEQADIADQRIDELGANYVGSPYPGIAETAAKKTELLKKKTASWRDESNKNLTQTKTKKDPKTMTVEELKAELNGAG